MKWVIQYNRVPLYMSHMSDVQEKKWCIKKKSDKQVNTYTASLKPNELIITLTKYFNECSAKFIKDIQLREFC